MAPLSRALRAELKSEERPQPSALALICPSALTLCALCCGMSAMRAASRGEFSGALVWLGLSASADGEFSGAIVWLGLSAIADGV
ncbi:hypothetical protein T492DRAFT_867153 [Pavlovales sp. CCMP2436]|nr:hypothetical protein T492DRAFT_867153 [Pavlovales sp. CCMP2436]